MINLNSFRHLGFLYCSGMLAAGCGFTSFHEGTQFEGEKRATVSDDAVKSDTFAQDDAVKDEIEKIVVDPDPDESVVGDPAPAPEPIPVADTSDDAEVAGLQTAPPEAVKPEENEMEPDPIVQPSDPETPGEVVDLCKNGTVLKFEQQMQFSEQIDCNFSSAANADDALTAGNLHRLDGHLMAREATSQSIDLPQNAIICGIDLASEEDDFRYDDFLVISLNQYALMISNKSLMQCDQDADPATCLAKDENEVWTWDFDRIKGRPHGFDGERYCFGYQEGAENTGTCVFPGHDMAGPVNFSLGTEAVSRLSVKLKDQNAFSLSVTATGDNDNEDCWHKALNLDVSVDYVLK